MKTEINALKFTAAWAAFEAAQELRKEAEAQNSAEQQAYIQPLFSEAFPALTAQGITYKNSWTVDEETYLKVIEWETSAQISEFCEKTASKNSGLIKELLKLEREVEINALNYALDMLEEDIANQLTPEQIKHFREKVNAEGWTYERQKFIEYTQKFINNLSIDKMNII